MIGSGGNDTRPHGWFQPLKSTQPRRWEVRHTQTRQTQDGTKAGRWASRSLSWEMQGSGLDRRKWLNLSRYTLSHFVPKDFRPPKVASMSVSPSRDPVHTSCLSGGV